MDDLVKIFLSAENILLRSLIIETDPLSDKTGAKPVNSPEDAPIKKDVYK